MNARASISQFLTRFDAPRAAPSRVDHSEQETADRRAAAVARAVEAARREGEGGGRAAAMREYENSLAQQEAAFHDRLVEARRNWASEESDRLAALFDAQLVRLSEELSDHIAAILTPLVGGHAAERMTLSLMERLDRLLRGAEAATIDIAGSADLVDAMRARCEARGLSAHYEISDGVDVALHCDATLIETRLSVWVEELNAAMRAE